jgi:NAD(P)-dependent dehydrogenase (short-subunit alcohol dehydrogenase family)
MATAQTWIITGAGRGLGRALTLAALEAGHTVLATVRDESQLDQLVTEHPRLTVAKLDVRDADAAEEVVGRAIALTGRLDVLVNNAGYGLVGTIEEASASEVRSIVDTNLLGPLWLSRAAIPVMRERGGGHIVQISTVGAVGTMPTLGLYNASKWGLEAFSEAMAAEVHRFGIRVSIIEPGALDTDWAGPSMRFSAPREVYDDLRTELFGSPEVPWPASPSGEGTPAGTAASTILAHVADHDDRRLRVLIGEDAVEQVRAALDLRHQDYALDPRYAAGGGVRYER